MSLKISKIFAIPLIFSSFLFDTNNEFNKVNANVKSSPANKNDLDLYHGMGVSFLCNATRKGFDLDFPKTLNVASATFASVVSQKHGGKIIERKKEQSIDIKQLQFIASLQLVESALKVCDGILPSLNHSVLAISFPPSLPLTETLIPLAPNLIHDCIALFIALL